METNELIDRFPRLFHMADRRAWDGIVDHGLLSTTALLDLYEIPPEERERIEGSRRPEIVVLEHPEHGTAYIRDNKPLTETKLANALDPGVSVADFLRLLNGKVFFWLTPERLGELLQARAYRDREHLILTLETQRLLDVYGDSVTLSPINSGATMYNAAPRGMDTFKSIAEYNYELRRRKRGPKKAIAELAVDYGIPDVLDYTLRANIRFPDGSEESIYG